MTSEQIDAIKLVLSVLHPPVIAQLSTGGTRETWETINAAARALEPLVNSQAAAKAGIEGLAQA